MSPSRYAYTAAAGLLIILAGCAKSAPAESVSPSPPPIPAATVAASATATPVTGMPVVAEPPVPDAATSAHRGAPGKPPPTLGKPKCICTPGDPTCNC